MFIYYTKNLKIWKIFYKLNTFIYRYFIYFLPKPLIAGSLGLGIDADCTPPDPSVCATVQDNSVYTVYNYFPCKILIFLDTTVSL